MSIDIDIYVSIDISSVNYEMAQKRADHLGLEFKT